jgi:hypothetical protein
VPGAELSSSEELVVSLDYSQFYLHTAEEDPDLAVDLLGDAQNGDGIAQQGGLVVVESPHQNNFEMPLRVEVWTAPPEDDLDEWQEAFEVHLDVGDDGLNYESPTLDITPLPVPPGSYHAIITGRGFVGHGWWPGSTTPGDAWRVRLWPSRGPDQPARLRTFDEGRDDVVTAQYLDSGRAAASRINDDLARGPRARELTPQTGIVRASYTYPGTRRRLFPYAADLSLWTSAGGSNTNVTVGGGYRLSGGNKLDRDFFDGLPTGWPRRPGDYSPWFELRATYRELAAPSTVISEMQWYLLTDLGTDRRETPFPAEPTVVRADLVQTKDSDCATSTTLTIERAHLPSTWVNDMTDVWRCKLEAGDRIYRLGR